MKRTSVVMVVLFAVAAAQWGCGPSKDDWEAKLNEVEDIEAQVAKLKKDYEDRIKELQNENDKIRTELSTFDEKKTSLEDLIKQLKKQEEQAKKRLKMFSNMLSKFKSLIEAGKLKIKIRDGKMVLELPSAVLFKSGQANLTKSGQETLLEVAPVLASIKGREFQVAGHTDNVPIKKSVFDSNWELSTARAVKVVRFLQKNGVKPKFLSASGYSQYRPLAKNTSAKGKASNRRIEIIVMPDLDELPNLKELEEMIEKE